MRVACAFFSLWWWKPAQGLMSPPPSRVHHRSSGALHSAHLNQHMQRVEPQGGQKAHMEVKSTARDGPRGKDQITHMVIKRRNMAYFDGPHGYLEVAHSTRCFPLGEASHRCERRTMWMLSPTRREERSCSRVFPQGIKSGNWTLVCLDLCKRCQKFVAGIQDSNTRQLKHYQLNSIQKR